MQKRKRTACVWPMRQKKNLKWFSHKNRTRSLFFPQNFILCYFRKSSHFTYVYIHIFAPSPLLIDTFGQFPFLTSRLTLTVIPPPPLHMEFVQCSPEKEEEDSGWRSVYVWVGFWALMCWESVRKKVVVKWRWPGCTATVNISDRNRPSRVCWGSIHHVQMAQCVLKD